MNQNSYFKNFWYLLFRVLPCVYSQIQIYRSIGVYKYMQIYMYLIRLNQILHYILYVLHYIDPIFKYILYYVNIYQIIYNTLYYKNYFVIFTAYFYHVMQAFSLMLKDLQSFMSLNPFFLNYRFNLMILLLTCHFPASGVGVIAKNILCSASTVP